MLFATLNHYQPHGLSLAFITDIVLVLSTCAWLRTCWFSMTRNNGGLVSLTCKGGSGSLTCSGGGG